MQAADKRTEGLLRKLRKLAGKTASEATPSSVHQVRTTIRRIETLAAALSDASASNTAKPLKRLGKLRKRAGKVRDLDVQLATLRGLQLDSGVKDKARLVGALEEEREKQARKLLKSLKGADVEDASRSLADTLATPPLPAGKRREQQAEHVKGALDKFEEALRQRGQLTEKNLHEFRMDCKKARYQAEIAIPDARAKTVVNELKRIQDATGEWHDWLTLAEAAEKLFSTDRPLPLLTALLAQKHIKFLHALQVIEECKRSLSTVRAGAPRKPAKSSMQATAAVA